MQMTLSTSAHLGTEQNNPRPKAEVSIKSLNYAGVFQQSEEAATKLPRGLGHEILTPTSLVGPLQDTCFLQLVLDLRGSDFMAPAKVEINYVGLLLVALHWI